MSKDYTRFVVGFVALIAVCLAVAIIGGVIIYRAGQASAQQANAETIRWADEQIRINGWKKHVLEQAAKMEAEGKSPEEVQKYFDSVDYEKPPASFQTPKPLASR